MDANELADRIEKKGLCGLCDYEPLDKFGADHRYEDTEEKRLILAALRKYVPHEAEWIWSLDAPEVSGWRWIETWDESKLELGILRFTVGDELPSNVACWRYVDPPSKSRAPVTTCEPHQGEKT
jgi:hypothetical protein